MIEENFIREQDLLRSQQMVVTNVKRTPEEKAALRIRIAQDKARARRWYKRRKERNALVKLPTEECTFTIVAVTTNEPRQVLKELLVNRLALRKESLELDIAIEIIRRTYNPSIW